VTSVKDFGFFVEISPHFIEGLVLTRSLPYDNWNIDDLETSMRGQKTNIQFDLGDEIQIQVVDVDRLQNRITFRYIRHQQRPDQK
jgi:ribonuclease R